ncbi:MAG: acyl-CoA thioesterase [Gammaproteobacteria bacterium]|nr:acyl-CoA thioesterase [Gammaproteobacteria bacterium]MDH5693268.1 acyl-CoA thioesterase [Gammaproteobacteria bacterium]
MNDKITTLPKDKQPVIRLAPMPADTNAAGDIFGGWIMSQVDIAGSIAAARRADGRVVTVAVNEFQFHQPVFVGDLVSCYADVVRVGRTSITTFIEVFVERKKKQDEVIKVTEATVTYVAVDKQRKPRPVDPN